ncbi:Protein SQS1 [Smittium mucronatum]|uniref:Protein SQS1 n=1 Tax=Smittium mucronatum TaxID=133383 RepID=A0A1R0GMB4_9FUNG|nr:Protein SQS1 [Smittium mucronatum]
MDKDAQDSSQLFVIDTNPAPSNLAQIKQHNSDEKKDVSKSVDLTTNSFGASEENSGNSTVSGNPTNSGSSISQKAADSVPSKTEYKTTSFGNKKYLTEEDLHSFLSFDLSGFELVPNSRRFQNNQSYNSSKKQLDFSSQIPKNNVVTEKADLQLGSISFSTTDFIPDTTNQNPLFDQIDDFIIELSEDEDSNSEDMFDNLLEDECISKHEDFGLNKKFMPKPKDTKKSKNPGSGNKHGNKERNKDKNKNKKPKREKEIPILKSINIDLVHKRVINLVSDNSISSLWLWPMNKRDRKLVRLLANEYNLICKSDGGGRLRHPILTRSKRTGFPNEKISCVKQILELAKKVDKNDTEGKSVPNRITKRQRDLKKGIFDFSSFELGGTSHIQTNKTAVVAEGVSSIGNTNKGHQMLAKMGWSPGKSLGATGDGIIDPVKAVMRDPRRGLGA